MGYLKDGSESYYEGSFFFHYKTAKAILVSTTGKEADAEWVPLSQNLTEAEPDLTGEAPEVDLCIPEWLAIEKGFV